MKRRVEEVTLEDGGITEGRGTAGGRMKRSWRDNGGGGGTLVELERKTWTKFKWLQ